MKNWILPVISANYTPRIVKKKGLSAAAQLETLCNVKLSLYKSSILPHLTYCHLVWNFCNASDRRKLERIQISELLDRAKPPTLYNRHLQDIATLMF